MCFHLLIHCKQEKNTILLLALPHTKWEQIKWIFSSFQSDRSGRFIRELCEEEKKLSPFKMALLI